MKKVTYRYEDFAQDTKSLLQEVRAFDAEAIIAIARGGYTLAHRMAEGLNIRNLQSLRTELYDDKCKREKIVLFDNCSLEQIRRVLVVDDIADSGETLAYVMQYLQRTYPEIEFQTVTLFYKKSSCYKPDYWVREADAWIEFFWEAEPT